MSHRLCIGLALLALSATAAAAPVPLDEAAAKGLLEQWLRAQNTQDFAAYQALYASKFDGIKRAGARTRSFNREAWLADRQRMFAKPMTVGADKVAIDVLPAMARVRFIQTFTLGRFHDQGAKELLLVREAGRVVIAREEMLSSTLGPVPREAGHDDLVVVPGGVLLPMSGESAWASGAPRLVARGNNEVYAAIRAVDGARLPAEARAWLGRPVSLVGGCTAKIQRVALLVRADPHFGTTQYWEGTVDEGGSPIENGKPLADAVIAREVWGLAPAELIGLLDRPCPDAQWGSVTAKPLPAAAVTPAPEALERAARGLMRKHPAYRKLQGEYHESLARSGGAKGKPWEADVKVSQVDSATQSMVVLSAGRFEGCGGFEGALTFVFARGAADRLTLINDPTAEPAWRLDQAADLDGDGTLELLGTEQGIAGGARLILRWKGDRYRVTGRSSETVLDCGC